MLATNTFSTEFIRPPTDSKVKSDNSPTPKVNSKKHADGGYFVTFTKDITDPKTESCNDQGVGSP